MSISVFGRLVASVVCSLTLSLSASAAGSVTYDFEDQPFGADTPLNITHVIKVSDVESGAVVLTKDKFAGD